MVVWRDAVGGDVVGSSALPCCFQSACDFAAATRAETAEAEGMSQGNVSCIGYTLKLLILLCPDTSSETIYTCSTRLYSINIKLEMSLKFVSTFLLWR